MVTIAAKKNSIKDILSRKISISLYQILFLLLIICLICRGILLSSTSAMNDVVQSKVETNASITGANSTHTKYNKCLENRYKTMDSNNEGIAINRHPTCRGFKTLSEMMNTMELPCNYIHDGFYLRDSNVALNEIYLTLVDMIEKYNSTQAEKIIPLVVEVGGHDGITKSISLRPVNA